MPFIVREVVNVRGKYFYDGQELATDPKYISLREWENQEHRASSSSIRRELGKHVFNMYSNDAIMVFYF